MPDVLTHPSPTTSAEPWLGCLAPHQKDAYRDVHADFADGATRTQLILPCGTGKTRVGAAVAASLAGTGERRVAVFVPSLALVEQTLREWSTVPGLDIDPVVVCSDAGTAAGAGDEVAVEEPRLAWHQRAVPVTTDPDRLARLLFRGPRHGQQVVFSTYHSAPAVAHAIEYAATPVVFDLLVADEAHRLAGDPSEAFAMVLEDDSIPAVRRLFMTATPVTADQGLPSARAPRVSMDDETLFGPVAHRLSFAQAIARGLLCDYQVLVVADDGEPEQSEGLDQDALGLASLRALRSAAVEHQMTRVLTFHGRVRSAERFIGFCNQAGPLADGRPVWGRMVSAETTIADRRKILGQLQDATGQLGVVASARCLSEGVDLPAVDGIVFTSPKHSLVDIVQSVGRVLRTAPGKTRGTIVLPVSLPAKSVPGGDDDSALLASAFGHVWTVLRALRAHDERLAHELDTVTFETSRRGTLTGLRDVDRVTWLLPDAWAPAAATRMIVETGSAWEAMFGRLTAFCDTHGHARVPAHHVAADGSQVGAWTHSQRRAYRRGVLTADRAARLESLPGWAWTGEQAHWAENHRALLEAVSTRPLDLGELPSTRAAGRDHKTLGEFAAAQRIAYRTGDLAPDRQALLEQVPGWRWQALDATDALMVDVLADYVAWEGDPNVPADYVDGTVHLGAWVHQLRRRKLLGTLPAALADEVAVVTPGPHTPQAFRWEQREAQWSLGLDALRAYAERAGHLRVPKGHREVVDGGPVDLGQWMSARRFEYRHQNMDPARARVLEQVPGWRWEVPPPATTKIDLGDTRHGTRTGYVRGCRCEECAESNRVYNRNRDERARIGLPTSDRIPAAATIAKLRQLVTAGATARALVRETGLSRSAVTKLLDGRVNEITAQTAARVADLTLERVVSNVAAKTLVDATPTWTLLEDILARGWPKAWVARELGSTGKSPALQIRRDTVTAETAQRVAGLAERLEGRVAPPRRRGEPLPSLAELLLTEHHDLAGAA